MKYLVYKGRRKYVKQWATEMGLSAALIHSRIKAGWSTERALTEPVLANKPRRGRNASPIFDDVRMRVAKSHAALSNQLHRQMRVFLKDFTDALTLHAEVAAKQMAATNVRLPAKRGE